MQVHNASGRALNRNSSLAGRARYSSQCPAMRPGHQTDCASSSVRNGRVQDRAASMVQHVRQGGTSGLLISLVVRFRSINCLGSPDHERTRFSSPDISFSSSLLLLSIFNTSDSLVEFLPLRLFRTFFFCLISFSSVNPVKAPLFFNFFRFTSSPAVLAP